MTTIERSTWTPRQLDNVAWQFLRSEFSDEIYAKWDIEGRLDAFLLHRGFRKLHDDAAAYRALRERVMANLPAAALLGLPPMTARGQVR